VARDHAQAVDWYRKAANQGNAIAQYDLGYAYENGYGVKADTLEAKQWYARAANQGHLGAQSRLVALAAPGAVMAVRKRALSIVSQLAGCSAAAALHPRPNACGSIVTHKRLLRYTSASRRVPHGSAALARFRSPASVVQRVELRFRSCLRGGGNALRLGQLTKRDGSMGAPSATRVMPSLSQIPVSRALQMLLRKAAEHATLLPADESAIRALRMRTQAVSAGADVVRQGDQPDVAVMVVSAMLARYHTLESGERQYISFHIAGDLPDVQSLLLDVMDHSLCALNAAEIGLVGHKELRDLFLRRPALCFGFWRLTLVDAAIFRQALTNNSARPQIARLAHLLCEQYYRAREAGLAQGESCSLPVSQTQLGQALGMSLVSVNRALKRLRAERLADLRLGTLTVHDWSGLERIAGFDPGYLHVAQVAEIARTRFKGRGD